MKTKTGEFEAGERSAVYACVSKLGLGTVKPYPLLDDLGPVTLETLRCTNCS